MPQLRSRLLTILFLIALAGMAFASTATASEARATSPGDTPEPPASPEASRAAERALEALAPHVRKQSHPEALRTAINAYFAFAAAHPDQVRNPYFFYVDYGLDNRTARGYVFDMKAMKLVEGPFTVAHGSGSSVRRNTVPTRFSNKPGSYRSSLGLYVAQETYTFRGRASGRRYSSIGLRMNGVSGSFNDAARRRGIVSHGAPYVTARDAGRSQGCPAMEEDRAQRLLPRIANGGLVFLYSPRDKRWLSEGPWVRAARSL